MASSRKTPMTLAEHVALGRELYETRDRLLQASVRIGNAYARGRAPSADPALRKVDALRSAMDDVLARDFPAEFCTHVYYPGPPEERAEHEADCATCSTPVPGR